METGSKRKHLLLVGAAVVFALLTVTVGRALLQREPQVAGQPASEFVRPLLDTNYLSLAAMTNQLRPLDPAVVVAAITRVLEREDTYWKQWYGSVHPRLPVWLGQRLPPSSLNRRLLINCGTVLATYGPAAEPGVPALATTYRRGDELTKLMVASQLARLGPSARAAIPALLQTAQAATNGTSDLRPSAIRALGKIDPSGQRSAEPLAGLLTDANAFVVTTTIDTLGSMARQSPDLIPELREALWHWRLPVRVIALRHLARLGALRREEIDLFLQRLTSDEAEGRASAATALGFAHQFAPVVVPGLRQATAEAPTNVVEAALASLALLAQATNAAASDRLAAAGTVLQLGSAQQSWQMIGLMPGLARETTGTVALLLRATGHPSERIRGQLAIALGQMGSPAREAIPVLRQLQTDEWHNVREAATNALRLLEATPIR